MSEPVKENKRSLLSRVFWLALVTLFLITVFLAGTPTSCVSYRKRGYDATANAAAKDAYTASQSYFTDYPKGIVDLEILKKYGLIQSQLVNISCGGNKETLKIITFSDKGKNKYQVDKKGNIERSLR